MTHVPPIRESALVGAVGLRYEARGGTCKKYSCRQ